MPPPPLAHLFDVLGRRRVEDREAILQVLAQVDHRVLDALHVAIGLRPRRPLVRDHDVGHRQHRHLLDGAERHQPGAIARSVVVADEVFGREHVDAVAPAGQLAPPAPPAAGCAAAAPPTADPRARTSCDSALMMRGA